jgi:c-di-GMP phosphodiesterase
MLDPSICAGAEFPETGVQPILDRRGVVFGYELLYQEAPGQQAQDPLGTARHSLLDALAIFGVERFTSGARAFIDCSVSSLVGDAWDGLPPAHTVLEIPAPEEPSSRLVRACRTLRDAGFQIALRHFDPDQSDMDLVKLADYVKVSAPILETASWSRVCDRLAGHHAIIIADGIHTHEAYCKARSLGIKYFQGYYFCNPELIPSGKIPAHHAHQFRILHELFKDPLELKTLCPLVMSDPSVVYRLLRFVNSPLCAVREQVTSVEGAIMMLGDKVFRRIATLAIQCGLSQDETPELLNMALLRARFCADAAALCRLDPDEQYLVGMLSLLPPMLRVPMDTILPALPLRPEICAALGGAPRAERALLAWIEHIEENDVPGCEQIVIDYDLDRDKLVETYWRALSGKTDLAE